MSDISTSKIPLLTQTNYNQWADNMKDWLQMHGLWRLVEGREKKPVTSDVEKLEKWELKCDKAAGAIRSTISHELKVHIRDCEDDPCLIWSTIKSTFIQQRSGPRFNAYHDLLAIQKLQDESLDSMINRVDQQIRTIKSLTPSKFTLDDLYDELAAMAIIRALPGDFRDITHTLSVLDKFKKDDVVTAIKNLSATSSHLSSIPALSTSSHSPSPSYPSSHHPSSSKKGKAPVKCTFCSRTNHTEDRCWTKAKLMKELQDKQSPVQAHSSTTQEHSTPPIPSSTTASVASLASSLSSTHHQLNSYNHWNADTGASAHMTPHRHWLRNFKPFQTRIELADGSAIYAEGTGSVQFQPVVNGQKMRIIEFSNILYVPQLSNNLLSVLYLAKHRNFHIHIAGNTMDFTLDNNTIFHANINSNNSAFLEGYTIPVPPASATLATTFPLDLGLWHRRFCHHNIAGIKKLISQNMVTRLG